ncbi:hypothetical protein QCA50_009415 [Cerrena zonata]|uniref:Uncharacterized protein n=1 Tax=Cerrena zonata TaxID=2478898 RepID=A0AAW0GES5_9APHY
MMIRESKITFWNHPIWSGASELSGVAIPEAGGLAVTGKHATVAGEPGIHIPKDPEALAAFETFEGDEKKLTPEEEAIEKKKQKKKVKRQQYKAKRKSKAAAAAAASGSAVPETTTTEGETELEPTPEPESVADTTLESNDKSLGKEEKSTLEAASIAGAGAAVGAATAGGVALSNDAHPSTLDPKALSQTSPESSKPSDELVTEESFEQPTTNRNSIAPVAGANILDNSKPINDSEEKKDPVVAAAKEESVPGIVSNPAVPNDVKDSTTAPAKDSAPEKEVDASPVVKSEEPKSTGTAAAAGTAVAGTAAGTAAAATSPKSKNLASEEEIVIAQGGEDSKSVKEQIVAANGDVTVEEIQPTESEAQRLTEEANLNKKTPSQSSKKSAAKTAAPAAAAAAPAAAAAAPAKDTKTAAPAKDTKSTAPSTTESDKKDKKKKKTSLCL